MIAKFVYSWCWHLFSFKLRLSWFLEGWVLFCHILEIWGIVRSWILFKSFVLACFLWYHAGGARRGTTLLEPGESESSNFPVDFFQPLKVQRSALLLLLDNGGFSLPTILTHPWQGWERVLCYYSLSSLPWHQVFWGRYFFYIILKIPASHLALSVILSQWCVGGCLVTAWRPCQKLMEHRCVSLTVSVEE